MYQYTNITLLFIIAYLLFLIIRGVINPDRPGVVYIPEGSMTEHRGDTARIVKAGDTLTEAGDTVHWMENTSGKDCVFIAVDLVVKK